MEAWIEFGRGPLFRLTFTLMLLGLARIFLLAALEIVAAYRRSSDRIVNWKEVARQSIAWFLPVGRLWRQRPFYSTASFVFHIGLLGVPLFLPAHVLLWRRALGFGWFEIPQAVADVLTLVTIAAALGLFFGRALHRGARALSRLQDYVWPLLLAVPFATGFVCANAAVGPQAYRVFMFVHVWSACAIMAMVPFTKVAHCVLFPVSQVATAVAWKFVPGAGDKVAATLGYAERPNWIPNSRLAAAPARPEEKKEVCAR